MFEGRSSLTQQRAVLQHVIVLPALASKQIFTCDAVVSATLFDVPPPTRPGIYHGKASFESSVTLLERPFFDGALACQLTMQYPVQLRSSVAPEQMATGEKNALELSLVNLGVLPVGAQLRIELGSAIQPTIAPELVVGEGVLLIPLQFDAKGTQQLSIPIRLAGHAELFQRYPWRVQVMYKDKLIQFAEGEIRMAPIFLPNTNADRSADILLITSTALSRDEYLAYNRIFSTLHLKASGAAVCLLCPRAH